jgi:hypothetical protein
MTAAKPAPILNELPSAERLKKGEWREEFLSPKPGSPKRLRAIDACELDRELSLGWIEPNTHATLARFAEELRKAGLVFSVRSSMEVGSTQGGGSFVADGAYLRARKIKDQQNALAKMGHEAHVLVLAALTQDWKLSRDGAKLMTKAAEILDGVYADAG